MRKQILILLILVFIFGLAPVNFSKAENLGGKLKGRILLQVESKGEAWYIDPSTQQRAYLGRPADAFRIMRELGLGISENNFNSFNGYAPKNLSGRILLRVEAKGEAYYVNPINLKMHFLGKPIDAFNIMKELGLGISNDDISNLQIYGEDFIIKDVYLKTNDGKFIQESQIVKVYNNKEEIIIPSLNNILNYQTHSCFHTIATTTSKIYFTDIACAAGGGYENLYVFDKNKNKVIILENISSIFTASGGFSISPDKLKIVIVKDKDGLIEGVSNKLYIFDLNKDMLFKIVYLNKDETLNRGCGNMSNFFDIKWQDEKKIAFQVYKIESECVEDMKQPIDYRLILIE